VILSPFFACTLVCLLAFSEPLPAQQTLATPAPAVAGVVAPAASTRIDAGSKLFIEPMDGFDTYLAAAILKKKVPVMVIGDRSKADFIVSGGSHVDKAGWAKTIFVSPLPHAEASISIKDAHSGNLVFAYNVDKSNAARANQSTAEACAKHLKEAIEKK
jgi:hypothetical protein